VISPDKKHLFSGHLDGTIRCWTQKNSGCLNNNPYIIQGSDAMVVNICITEDNQILIAQYGCDDFMSAHAYNLTDEHRWMTQRFALVIKDARTNNNQLQTAASISAKVKKYIVASILTLAGIVTSLYCKRK
jgi:WD40 repeat protein